MSLASECLSGGAGAKSSQTERAQANRCVDDLLTSDVKAGQCSLRPNPTGARTASGVGYDCYSLKLASVVQLLPPARPALQLSLYYTDAPRWLVLTWGNVKAGAQSAVSAALQLTYPTTPAAMTSSSLGGINVLALPAGAAAAPQQPPSQPQHRVATVTAIHRHIPPHPLIPGRVAASPQRGGARNLTSAPMQSTPVLTQAPPAPPSMPTSASRGAVGATACSRCYKPLLRLRCAQFKIRGREPEDLPADYDERIRGAAAAHLGSGTRLVDIYVRRGCIELTLDLERPDDEAAETGAPFSPSCSTDSASNSFSEDDADEAEDTCAADHTATTTTTTTATTTTTTTVSGGHDRSGSSTGSSAAAALRSHHQPMRRQPMELISQEAAGAVVRRIFPRPPEASVPVPYDDMHHLHALHSAPAVALLPSAVQSKAATDSSSVVQHPAALYAPMPHNTAGLDGASAASGRPGVEATADGAALVRISRVCNQMTVAGSVLTLEPPEVLRRRGAGVTAAAAVGAIIAATEPEITTMMVGASSLAPTLRTPAITRLHPRVVGLRQGMRQQAAVAVAPAAALGAPAPAPVAEEQTMEGVLFAEAARASGASGRLSDEFAAAAVTPPAGVSGAERAAAAVRGGAGAAATPSAPLVLEVEISPPPHFTAAELQAALSAGNGGSTRTPARRSFSIRRSSTITTAATAAAAAITGGAGRDASGVGRSGSPLAPPSLELLIRCGGRYLPAHIAPAPSTSGAEESCGESSSHSSASLPPSAPSSHRFLITLLEPPPASCGVLLVDLRWRGRPWQVLPVLLLDLDLDLDSDLGVPRLYEQQHRQQQQQQQQRYEEMVSELAGVAESWTGPPQELDGLLYDTGAWVRCTAARRAATTASAVASLLPPAAAAAVGPTHITAPAPAYLPVLGASLLQFAHAQGLRGMAGVLQGDMRNGGYTASFRSLLGGGLPAAVDLPTHQLHFTPDAQLRRRGASMAHIDSPFTSAGPAAAANLATASPRPAWPPATAPASWPPPSHQLPTSRRQPNPPSAAAAATRAQDPSLSGARDAVTHGVRSLSCCNADCGGASEGAPTQLTAGAGREPCISTNAGRTGGRGRRMTSGLAAAVAAAERPAACLVAAAGGDTEPIPEHDDFSWGVPASGLPAAALRLGHVAGALASQSLVPLLPRTPAAATEEVVHETCGVQVEPYGVMAPGFIPLMDLVILLELLLHRLTLPAAGRGEGYSGSGGNSSATGLGEAHTHISPHSRAEAAAADAVPLMPLLAVLMLTALPAALSCASWLLSLMLLRSGPRARLGSAWVRALSNPAGPVKLVRHSWLVLSRLVAIWGLQGYYLGPGALVVEGVMVPAVCLLPPGAALLLAAVKLPLYAATSHAAAMATAAAAIVRNAAEDDSRGQVMVPYGVGARTASGSQWGEAVLRSLAVTLVGLLTTVTCHVYLRLRVGRQQQQARQGRTVMAGKWLVQKSCKGEDRGLVFGGGGSSTSGGGGSGGATLRVGPRDGNERK